MAVDVTEYVDTGRYPIDQPGPSRDAVIATATADLERHGCAVLKGFVHPERIADLVEDAALLQQARQVAMRVLEEDPALTEPRHAPIANAMRERADEVVWGRIS